MSEFNEKEYNSVILGALLHDVGKMFQRAKGEDSVKGKHADISANFITGKKEFSKNNQKNNISFKSFLDKLEKSNAIDSNIVEKVAKFHSSPHTPEEENLLELIVNQADSYSSNERRTISEKQGVGGGKFTPLFSVFKEIKLDKKIPEDWFPYKAIPLNSKLAFSDPHDKKTKLEDTEVSKLVDCFKKELREMNKNAKTDFTFYNFYNSLLAILEKYLCFLPCDTSLDYPDVSLFDHLKSTSAISACLYHYHQQDDTLLNSKENQENVRDKSSKKFILVGGELSGIQNYIYQISSITGEGGVAKRLRARSFYVSVLMEIIVLKLLRTLNLPFSCNLICSGGKFEILAPNTTIVREILTTNYKEITDWLIEEFSGELVLNMVWDIEISGEDFHTKEEDKLESNEYNGSNFYDFFKKLGLSLRKKNKNKFSESLIKENKWDENAFIRIQKYKEYEETGKTCKSCEKFPAKYPDSHEEKNNKGKSIFCEKCAIDKVIGRKLLDAKYIAIGIDNSGKKYANEISKKFMEREFFFFFNEKYFIQVLKKFEFDNDYFIVEKIRETEEEPIEIGMVNRFIGNYVPMFHEKSEIEALCKKCKLDKCVYYEGIIKKTKEKHLYTFECIAATSSSLEQKGFESKPLLLGNQMIGVLKADVDNLGRIFSEGLRERLTISRYLTISRMIDLFFSGWLFRTLKEDVQFKNIYTVYSGGDDLLLIGPWEDIINFSKYLNDEFRRFTCNNDNITLSAGISIVNPKKSISLVVDQANKNIQKSKAVKDKDSLTIWDTTIYWKEFKNLKDFMEVLKKGYLSFPEILSKQFIHRLLKYHKMFLDANDLDNKKIEGLMFHSKMNYDVRRNIIDRLEEINLLEIIFLANKEDFFVKELETDEREIGKLVSDLNELFNNGLIEYSKENKLTLDSTIKIKITQKGKIELNKNKDELEAKKEFNKIIPLELSRLYLATIDRNSYDKDLMKNLKIPVFWTLYKTREIPKEGNKNGN